MRKACTYDEKPDSMECNHEIGSENRKTSDNLRTTGGSYRAVSEKERALILKVAQQHYAGPWIKTMLFCGLSPGETALVTGKDVDIQKKTLHVPATKASGNDRIVPIPDSLISTLTGFDDDSYIFSTIYNTPLTRRRIYRWWANFKRAMNLELGAKTYRNKLLEDKLPTLKNLPEESDLSLYCLQQTYYSDLQSPKYH